MDQKTYTEGRQDAQIDALFAAVERIEESQRLSRTEIREEFQDAIAPVRKAVLGNGNPRHGLASRVEFHDKIIKLQLGMLTSLFIAMIAFIFLH